MRDEQHTRAAARAVSRREFLASLGSTAAALSVITVVGDCGGSSSTAPPPLRTGSVKGTVTDLQGNPQGVGRIYLLTDGGLNQNIYSDADASGHWSLSAIPVGKHQVRFWGGNLADVPETFDNPVRITIVENQTVTVDFKIELGGLEGTDREIYVGDDFFQEQPYGQTDATVVVPLGTEVCWYNVGTKIHTVSGGPWGDSGDIAPIGNFMWTANVTGTFPYRCNYHTGMQATLQVVPA
ncbi:MAG TPA: hypothetical protein VG818_07530 [Gemmatimonadaceae bacterium]|nr:hypothetical protein [Gemmatimonadaceae bacterium]